MNELLTNFHESFKAFVLNDIDKSLTANLEVGTIILTIVGIEAISGNLCGKKASRATFNEFMRRYMPVYTNYSDDIYSSIRVGLLHDYTIRQENTTQTSFMFTRDKGEPHLTPVKGKTDLTYLNREQLALDFLDGAESYFADLENDLNLQKNAAKRLSDYKDRGFLVVLPEP